MNDHFKPIVGFIGLGLTGAMMASNLQRAGYDLIVTDESHEAATSHLQAGAAWVDTPREVAWQSEVVLSCLPSPAAVEAVVFGPDGLLAGMQRGQAFFEMSINSPDLLKRLHAACVERGVHMLEAPVSRGGGRSQGGPMTIWAGGDEYTFNRYKAVLGALADNPVHVGAVGAGLITKLVNNCISQATQAAITEIFVLGVKAGAEPLALWEAVRQGSAGRRRTLDGLIDEFLPGNFDPPHAELRIIHEDMMIATELGRELGVPLRFANLALADIQEAMNRGWSERDCRAVTLLPQERSGVEIKVDATVIREVLRRDPPAPTDNEYVSADRE